MTKRTTSHHVSKAKAKRPQFRINDRITIAAYTPLVPAYGGKPFVGRNTILRVSSITGKGSLREPYFVHVTDDEGHFWQFPPDDIIQAKEVHHATKKTSSAPKATAKIEREIDQSLVDAGAKPLFESSHRGKHGPLVR